MTFERAPKTFEEMFVNEMVDKLGLLEAALASDKARDFAEYRYMTGQYRGLKVALNTFEQMLADYHREDNDQP